MAYFSALAAAESPVTLVPTCWGADVGLVYAALSTGYLATGGFVPKAFNFWSGVSPVTLFGVVGLFGFDERVFGTLPVAWAAVGEATVLLPRVFGALPAGAYAATGFVPSVPGGL